MSIALKVDGQRPKTVYMAKRRQQVGMRLEIDMPEHHYNNIMAFDSVNLGRVPYKGIIMNAINAIKHGKVLDQEPTNKSDLGVEKIEVRKPCINYEDGCEEWAGCPCVHYKGRE